MIFTKVFFIFSKILSFAVDPFFWIIILLLLALFAKKKYRRPQYLVSALILTFVFSSSPIYKITFEYWKIKQDIPYQKFDAGILLGGMISLSSSDENILFNEYNDRLLNTLELFHKGIIKKIIITGASGSLSSDLKEADIIKSFLIRIGVPREKIIVENQSKNTHENAIYTELTCKELEMDKYSFLLITSDYHMRRSLSCFKKTGLNITPFVKESDEFHFDLEYLIVPQTNVLFKWKVLFHEIVGYFVYKLMGYV
ncbi:MAG: YdcF family protein [Bacteroidota bacterium]|nr:YdcF family protein [Bacteroidota bacterium]